MSKQQFLDSSGLNVLVEEILQRIHERGQVVTYKSTTAFPVTGEENVIYIDASHNAVYRWDDDNIKYYCIGRDYSEIEAIYGGDSSTYL